MALFLPFNVCRARRRRVSLVTKVLVLGLVLVGSVWFTFLMVQARQEGLEFESFRQQKLSAVDYKVFRADDRQNNVIRSLNNVAIRQKVTDDSNIIRLAQTNGRLPKGIEIQPPISQNATNEQLITSSSPSPHTTSSSSSEPNSDISASKKSDRGTQNSSRPSTFLQSNTLDSLPSQYGPDSVQILRESLVRANREQVIFNADKFPKLAPDGIVLIVQVHRRDGYLRELFNSMRKVRGIENVLLVISHDYFYDDIMKLVKSVDFCRVTQIFYPFSLQVYPDSFPGTSTNDCPRDSTRQQAQERNCTNAKHPDTYGHYREAKITAVKHHWWWKANVVFDWLDATKDFSGHIIFLEEDHYLSPDFLHVAEKLIALKDEKCTDCDFINLGMYTSSKSVNSYMHRASVGIWNAGKNNMGFGMNRNTWELIKSCKQHFCTYDDYNWDWSINSMGQSCLKRNLKVLVAKAPRIYHIGNCGVHHRKVCNEKRDSEKAEVKLQAIKSNMFPNSLRLDLGVYPPASRKKVKAYGGWGDIRDHSLCLSFVDNPFRTTV